MEKELKKYLIFLADQYETPSFIAEDPIQLPHLYTTQADIEISALIASWIATGNRKAILKTACQIDQEIFRKQPYYFILRKEWEKYAGIEKSFYRYYSYDDFFQLCQTLYHVYTRQETLEAYLLHTSSESTPLRRLQSVMGHINGMPALSSSSEAKKMCMFLRWMIRRNSVVDFGLWKGFSPRELIIPLDTHVHRIAIGFNSWNQFPYELHTVFSFWPQNRLQKLLLYLSQ